MVSSLLRRMHLKLKSLRQNKKNAEAPCDEQGVFFVSKVLQSVLYLRKRVFAVEPSGYGLHTGSEDVILDRKCE